MEQLQHEPASIQELQDSYNQLYQGWMGKHKNIGQADRILDLLQAQPGKYLADIGCGLGYMLDMARERGIRAVGADISMVALRQAKKDNRWPPSVFIGGAENLPLANQSIDYVSILGSLEHFLDLPRAVQETTRILKHDGKAAILVPNSHHIRAIYNVYKFGEILPEMQDFERFATRKEWERLFTSNGLKVISVHKYDLGMARSFKKDREIFWYLYNILFRLLGNIWIPLNLTYTFIFLCEPG